MYLLRQNSDYALRFVLNLADHGRGEVMSAKALADAEQVSYQFTCKILQKLHEAELVESVMGPKGGYRLSRAAQEISMQDVIWAMQGDTAISDCSKGIESCPRQPRCPVNIKLAELQRLIDSFLSGVTLEELGLIVKQQECRQTDGN